MSTRSTFRPGWAPWTFKGVAAYAQASAWRLVIVEALVACAVAASVAIVAVNCWLPAVDQAVRKLPEKAAISQGTLRWPGVLPQQLTTSRFLSIVVVSASDTRVGQVADVQVELSSRKWRIRSLLGFMEFDYPEGWRVDFDRHEIEPWWGARRQFAVAVIVVATLIAMPLLWAVVALIYAPLVKILALFGNRSLSFGGAWKLCSAALMLGAALMCAVIVVYGMQRLPLAVFLGGFAVHLVVGWVYLLVSPFRVGKAGNLSGRSRNPFGKEKKGGGGGSNPFS